MADLLVAPWYADTLDCIEWWTDPALAYAKGLQDGARLACEQRDAELEAVLLEALGGGRDRREAVDRLISSLTRKATRDALDAEAAERSEAEYTQMELVTSW